MLITLTTEPAAPVAGESVVLGARSGTDSFVFAYEIVSTPQSSYLTKELLLAAEAATTRVSPLGAAALGVVGDRFVPDAHGRFGVRVYALRACATARAFPGDPPGCGGYELVETAIFAIEVAEARAEDVRDADATAPRRSERASAIVVAMHMRADMHPTVVVTGAAGCLGHAVVDQLLEPGAPLEPARVCAFDVRTSARAAHPRLVEVVGDVRDEAAVARAVRGADVVIHCAAAVDWGQTPEAELHAVNVGGTAAVIGACRREGVRALVHTSTLDVLFTGRPIVDADESQPYPAQHPNAYCRTKAEGEMRALAANGAALRTAVVRPCVIFGERDPFHVPALLERARRGRLVRIGDGRAQAQFSYVGNVAHTLLLAARSLLSPEARAAGRVYFATDGERGNFFDFLAPFVEAGGGRMPPAYLRVPAAPLRALGAVLEGVARASRPYVQFRPTLTRFAVDFICNDYTVRTDRAVRELGYAPRYGREEALARTIAWQRR